MGCAPQIPKGLEAGLRAHDSRLRLRWDGQRNKWAIDEIGLTSGKPMFCFYWDTPVGFYRELPRTPDPILAKLAEYDMTRFGGTNRQKMIQLTNEMDAGRRRWLADRQEKWENAIRERRDFAMRATGKRQTYGPAGPRTRRTTRFSKPGDPNLQSFLKEMQESSMQPSAPL